MAKLIDAQIVGLNEVLRDLRALPKEASKELRKSSKAIAEKHMVPAWKDAALTYAGPWGKTIAGSVRAGSDRLPKVMIGSTKRTMSGGASATMVRYPSDKGNRGRAAKGATNRMPPAFGSGTDWIGEARSYVPDALAEWGKAVDSIVTKWNKT